MIIVNHIGTSVIGTLEKELLPFVEMVRASVQEKVVLAFSSKRAVEKLRAKHFDVMHIETVIESANEPLKILPVHLVGGTDLENLKSKYSDLEFLPPLLSNHEDCEAFAKVLSELINDEQHTLFIGHGTKDASHKMYEVLEHCLKKYTAHVTVMTLADDVSQLKIEKELVMFPLFTVAGHHVKKDLFRLPTSFKCQLLDQGYDVTTIEKGLLSYESIRQLYINKIVR